MVLDVKEDGDQRDRSTAVTVEEQLEDEARQPKVPLSIGRPTKREMEEHCVSHWPFRSWCRHCVCGRAQGSPHRARGESDRQMGRHGPPTISLDHCFLGAEGEENTALGSPFLVLVDNASEAIYTVACSTKGCTPWIVEYVHSILFELGYAGVTVSMKCDGAPELK